MAALLAAKTVEDAVSVLEQYLGDNSSGQPDPAELLRRYLKKLSVRKLWLANVKPSKRAIERGDVDQLVREFRAFVSDALAAGDEELPVVELE